LQNYPLVSDGGVTQLSSYVVNYLKYLVLEYSSPINKVLRIEQSWQVDEDQPEEMDLSTGILHFMQALERHLEARSKEYSNAALRHIFMMNNLYYVRTRAKKSKLGPLLSETWLSDLGRKVRIKLFSSGSKEIKTTSYCLCLGGATCTPVSEGSLATSAGSS
jgi:hypothetical protein